MAMPADLDEVDHQILQLLRQNSRRTLGDMGTRVGLSAPSVKRRIDRLEKLGVIRAYTAILDPAATGHELEAFVELRLHGDVPVSVIDSIADEVPEIRALYSVAGDPDALAWIRAADSDDLKRIIDSIRKTGNVTGTKTLIVLASVTRAHF